MKKILTGIVIFFVLGAAFLILSRGPAQAWGANNDGDIMAKLDQIAKGQEELVATVNSMKEDIQLIKIRVTQLQ